MYDAETEESVPVVVSAYPDGSPEFAPVGPWIAYTSKESGSREVYLVGFPGTKRRIQISRDGGRAPAWRSDGRELFYVAGEKFMSVPIDWDARNAEAAHSSRALRACGSASLRRIGTTASTRAGVAS